MSKLFLYLLHKHPLVCTFIVGERKVFIANINCEVYVRRDSFQLVSSEGDTLLPAILCEKGMN